MYKLSDVRDGAKGNYIIIVVFMVRFSHTFRYHNPYQKSIYPHMDVITGFVKDIDDSFLIYLDATFSGFLF